MSHVKIHKYFVTIDDIFLELIFLHNDGMKLQSTFVFNVVKYNTTDSVMPNVQNLELIATPTLTKIREKELVHNGQMLIC